jgi:homoserine acetyltransferase
MDPGTLAAKPTYQPYLEMPVTYLICTIDWAIPATKQRYYVEEAIKAGGKDNLNVIEMDCGHSPMLKNPNFAVEVIDKAAKAALGVL